MPTADELRALRGADVSITLKPEAGSQVVEGRLVGTLEAADGLVVVVQPHGDSERRFSCNYQHIASVERRARRAPAPSSGAAEPAAHPPVTSPRRDPSEQ